MRNFWLATAAMVLASGAANATTITSGATSLGLFDNARLGSGGVGVARAGLGDAITPGCLCEGWGVAGGGVARSTYGNGFTNTGAAALTDVTASSATSTTATDIGLQVVHRYSAIAGTDLFRIGIDITNTSASTITDVRYSRTLDWDVDPGHFSDDFTTVFGGPAGIGGKLLHTSFNPFAQPDPLVFRGAFGGNPPNTNGTNRPGDLGGYFVFGFGSLDAGATTSFETIIGSAEDVRTLLAQFGALDVEAFHYTFDNDGPAVFGYGFVGVGLPPIDTPAPAAAALFGLGALGLGFARRR